MPGCCLSRAARSQWSTPRKLRLLWPHWRAGSGLHPHQRGCGQKCKLLVKLLCLPRLNFGMLLGSTFSTSMFQCVLSNGAPLPVQGLEA